METLPGRRRAGLQMGWARAKGEKRETWKPECACTAREVARPGVAPSSLEKSPAVGASARGPAQGPVGGLAGGAPTREGVGAHVCLGGHSKDTQATINNDNL